MYLVGRKSRSQQWFIVCNTVFMVLFMMIILYPVLNILAISLSEYPSVNWPGFSLPIGWD